MVAPPLLVSAPALRKLTLWHYLTILVVSLWKALAMVFLFRNVFVYYNVSSADKIIEECTQEEPHDMPMDNYMCHYLSLWIKYFDVARNDMQSFVNGFLLLTIIFTLHFIVSSFILMMGGVIKSNYLAFIPWLVTMIMMVVAMVVLILGEVTLKQGEDAAQVTVGCAAYILLGAMAFALFSWFTTFVTCLKTKQGFEVVANPRQKFDYYRFF